MNPIQTGIAVALALAVVTGVFMFPGLFPISTTGIDQDAAAVAFTTDQNATTTMPIENNGQLQITDVVVGSGAAVAPGDRVTVTYVGSFPDGTVFDASANHSPTGVPFVIGVGAVIKGWDEGLIGMKEGGKRRLVVPPTLGYGRSDYGPIPGNSTLLFEIELLKVEKGR